MGEKTQKIVRLYRKDLPGEQSIDNALQKIRGISFSTAQAIRKKCGIEKGKKMGDLSEAEIKKIEHYIGAPQDMNMPAWILNRRKDPQSGITTHIVESEIMLRHREDLETMKKIRSYRGVRHMFGLPVRGQRTKSTGRKESTIGVHRKGKSGDKGGK